MPNTQTNKQAGIKTSFHNRLVSSSANVSSKIKSRSDASKTYLNML